jgi:hypothetical protein
MEAGWLRLEESGSEGNALGTAFKTLFAKPASSSRKAASEWKREVSSGLTSSSPGLLSAWAPLSEVSTASRSCAAVGWSKVSEMITVFSGHCSTMTGPSSVSISARQRGQFTPAQFGDAGDVGC